MSPLAIVLVAVLTWKLLCRKLRSNRARIIAALDPLHDALPLLKITNFVEFPFLTYRALEFGLFRTFAIPSISKLLHANGQFGTALNKSYDDTYILVQELIHSHVDSPRGSLALRRLNFIHGRYNISNSNYLYTLSVFILEPIRFAAKYGFRQWTESEKTAYFRIWCDIGTRMGIQDIPESLDEMDSFNRQYKVEQMVFSNSNRMIGDATMNLLLSNIPACLHLVGKRIIFALCDDRLLDAMGYPRQPYWMTWFVQTLLRLCVGTFVGLLLPPRPRGWSTERISLEEGCGPEEIIGERVYKLKFDVHKPGTYPNGYKITDVGDAKPGEMGKPFGGALLCPLLAFNSKSKKVR
eukprot:Gb_25975 [translate_table: standard]